MKLTIGRMYELVGTVTDLVNENSDDINKALLFSEMGDFITSNRLNDQVTKRTRLMHLITERLDDYVNYFNRE